MNGYADDLAAVVRALDLNDVSMVGHSTGGGEVARYIGRHGTDRVAKVAEVSQGLLDQFWAWSMQAGLLNAYESVKAFSETDFTEDLAKIDVPTLVLHGEDDQIVPVKDSARKSAQLIENARDIYYAGAPHGITATHQDRVNADLLAFLQS